MINYSNNVHCYLLTHVTETILFSGFSEATCLQSPLPFSLYRFAEYGVATLTADFNSLFEEIYTPYSSPEYGMELFHTSMEIMNTSFMCGDQLLVTPDSFEDSSVRITQGEKRWADKRYELHRLCSTR